MKGGRCIGNWEDRCLVNPTNLWASWCSVSRKGHYWPTEKVNARHNQQKRKVHSVASRCYLEVKRLEYNINYNWLKNEKDSFRDKGGLCVYKIRVYMRKRFNICLLRKVVSSLCVGDSKSWGAMNVEGKCVVFSWTIGFWAGWYGGGTILNFLPLQKLRGWLLMGFNRGLWFVVRTTPFLEESGAKRGLWNNPVCRGIFINSIF